MSRASARQVHCEAVIPYVECTNAVPNCTRLATSWRIGGLRSRGGAVSARSRAHDGVHIARRFHATSTATLKSLNRVCHCCFSLLDRSLNLQSEPAVIVRHWIVKPRLDDELAAVDCFRCWRPRAWRDANAVIANLIHPLVYAPGANMPQDALDDLRVIDERHGAHLVMTLGCHGTKKRIDFPDLLDEVPPLLRRDAPRPDRTMLDDFNRRACERTTPLLRCCRGIVRGLLLRLLCTLPALAAHLVGVPAVVTHHLKALIRNVLRDRCDEIARREYLRE